LVTIAERIEDDKTSGFLIEALEKETDAFNCDKLAEGLAKVAGRMKAPAASRVSGQAANILIKALEKETDSNARTKLASGLVAVTGPIEPDKAARIVTQALEKEIDANARNVLVQGLAAVSRKSSRAEARQTHFKFSKMNDLGQRADVPGRSDGEDSQCRRSLLLCSNACKAFPIHAGNAKTSSINSRIFSCSASAALLPAAMTSWR
jgi:hypothetical protein